MSIPADIQKRVGGYLKYKYSFTDTDLTFVFREFWDTALRSYVNEDDIEQMGEKLMEAWWNHEPNKAKKRT